MNLGAFSVSLNVNNLGDSKVFYEKLGFTKLGGDENDHWLILRNGDCVIGLFQGMFERNLITFNPGWDQRGENLESFVDIRKIQQELKTMDVEIIDEADESTNGPASFMLTDPDGNQILIDQHR